SLTLSSAANLPSSIPVGKVLVITLNDAATRQQFEVIYATAISGATLSGLLRGQENTSAQAWSTGDYAYCSPTMGQMQAFGQLGDNNTWTGNNTFNNPVVVAGAPAGSATAAVNQGQFESQLGQGGWKEYPDPNSPSGFFVEQWGYVSVPPGNSNIFNFPKQFPVACINIIGCQQRSATNTAVFLGWDISWATQLIVSNGDSTTHNGYYMARGY
ncbi:gp53-like domain-containing protein, partial [Klebsiella pneumoniae]|uniref:gp53-like domain-containing protein n=1 Tax=Klebsiella pneumoniae TaxID=573 RepID=UPI00300731F1